MNKFNLIILLLLILTPFMGNNVLPYPSRSNDAHFTPYGMLQNPYHVWPKNPSGILRSSPAIGFDWIVGWGWNFPSRPIYMASLKVGVNVDGQRFYTREDFAERGVDLYSKHHSKNVMSYDWRYAGLTFSFKFFLVNGDSLACLAEITNDNVDTKVVSLHLIGRLFTPRPYSVYGWTKPDHLLLLSKSLRVTLVLGANETCLAQKFARSEASIKEWIKDDDFSNMKSSSGLFVLHGMMSFKVKIPPKSCKKVLFALGRGDSYERALSNMIACLKNADRALKEKLKEDRRFWSRAPKLIGDWPERWVNGLVYDFETLRMVVYPPSGVFKHRWDGMHVNWPRNVIAETSIDMFIMSYADEDLSKEVLLGLFEDALAPNVPCVHADGSFNMVAEDGSKCGTSPAWCFPFYIYSLIYSRTYDKEWLRKIYPYWSNYLKWWLKNRADKDGWLHYKCSWESGEDLAPRFGRQFSGGQLIEHIRASELQAVMAHAAKTMAFYAEELGLGEDEVAFWERIYREYYHKLQMMWFKDWFHDYDTKAGRFTEYKDPLHLAPIFLGLADEREVHEMVNHRNVNELLKEFERSVGVKTLEWPSLTFPYVEALWVVGEADGKVKELLLRQVYGLINKVYSMADAKVWRRGYPIPGVSYENWSPPKAARVEGYGWGALTALLIIRDVIGFREIPLSDEMAFLLSPGLPDPLAQKGKRYGIENLRFRDITLNITYKVREGGLLGVSIKYSSGKECAVKILDRNGKTIYEQDAFGNCGEINFLALNKMTYKVIFKEKR